MGVAGLAEQVTLRGRMEGGEGRTTRISGKRLPGSGNNRSRCPEVEAGLVCSRNGKEAGVARLGCERGGAGEVWSERQQVHWEGLAGS